MHIIQFWRIFWAKRLLIAATTVFCLLGGLTVGKLLPPRYESHARVMLGLLKADPVTGLSLSGSSMGAYVNTQIALISDFTVAGKVADAVGWNSDPNLIQAYQNRSKKDERDFQHWLAQRVIDRTKARLLDESNILDISFSSNNARDAQAVTEVLERAYIDTSVALHREDASRQASWFDQQADTARTALVKAQTEKTDYERANGVMMQDDKQDLDSARLQMLTQQAAVPNAAAPPVQSSQAAIELAQLDAVIAQQTKILGPNHPDLIAMKAKRSALAAVAAKDEAAQRAAYGAGARAINSALEHQKSQVIAQADKLEHLKQLQSEINLRREQFDKATGQAATAREQAAVQDNGLSILGHATTPSAPSFPNMMLIVPGSAALGFVFGVLLALLTEFLARRVRGVEDLNGLDDAPVLAVIPAPEASSRRKARKEAVGRRPNVKDGRLASA